MKSYKSYFCLILFICGSSLISANDGSYFMSGNQLIPIMESDIRITKEILQIKRIDEEWVKITVDYTFENPSEDKNIIVGFEASAPSGDGDISGWPKTHPYMRGFEVVMNDQSLTYQSAIVPIENYYHHGKIRPSERRKVTGPEDFGSNMFVYYFDAHFQSGVNKIHHEYTYKMSNSVISWCEIDYVLTAANRWANKQIDDFKLVIDFGHYTLIQIQPNFFQGKKGWHSAAHIFESGEIMNFIEGGRSLKFHARNFHPDGELHIMMRRCNYEDQVSTFDSRTSELDYNLMDFDFTTTTANQESYSILRSYPFARRGCVFQSELIRAYYQKLPWYFENPNYRADEQRLSRRERQWLRDLDRANGQ